MPIRHRPATAPSSPAVPLPPIAPLASGNSPQSSQPHPLPTSSSPDIFEPAPAMPNSPRQRLSRTNSNSPQIPTHLRDPLSGELLKDPVIAPDGMTYSKATILAHLAENDNRLPNSELEVAPSNLFVHRNRKAELEEFGSKSSANSEIATPVCPISLCEPTEPVVASDGNTYDLTHLEQSFAIKTTSPLTREELKHFVFRDLSLATTSEPQEASDEAQPGIIWLEPPTRYNPRRIQNRPLPTFEIEITESDFSQIISESHLPQLIVVGGTVTGATLGMLAGAFFSSPSLAAILALNGAVLGRLLVEDYAFTMLLRNIEARVQERIENEFL